jgi:hypothetical protein
MNDTMSAELKLRLLAQIQTEPSATRRGVAAQTAVLALASAAAALVVFELLHGLRGWPGGVSPWRVAGGAAGWVAAAVLTTWGALARGRAGTGDAREVLVAVAALTPLVLFAWMTVWGGGAPLVYPLRLELACLAQGVVTGLLPLVTLLQVRRGTDPEHPGLTGAALGVAAGAWSGILVTLWCPVAAAPHVLVGQVLPLVVLSAVGAALGRRVLGVRYEG